MSNAFQIDFLIWTMRRPDNYNHCLSYCNISLSYLNSERLLLIRDMNMIMISDIQIIKNRD